MYFKSISILLLGLVSSQAVAPPAPEQIHDNFDFGEQAREMLCLVNKFRGEFGLPPVFIDSRLMEASHSHSFNQAVRQTMSHFGSQGDDFNDRDQQAGFVGNSGAENVAVGQNSVAEVMETWINSPGHMANLLSNNRCFGYGEVQSYWTQNFGSGDSCSSQALPDCSGL